MEQQKTRMPAIFVGHGSPMIALEHNDLTATYKELGQTILKRFGRPKAILMISAHGTRAAHSCRAPKSRARSTTCTASPRSSTSSSTSLQAAPT